MVCRDVGIVHRDLLSGWVAMRLCGTVLQSHWRIRREIVRYKHTVYSDEHDIHLVYIDEFCLPFLLDFHVWEEVRVGNHYTASRPSELVDYELL